MLEQVTIVMPTANRRSWAETVFKNVAHRPFIVVVDKGRQEADLPTEFTSNVQIVECEPGCGVAIAMETGIASVRTKYFVNLCDDMEFTTESEGWLEELCRVYLSRIGQADGFVSIRDGIQNGNIGCFGLMSKEFYMQHLYPTPYKRFFGDTELTEKAKKLGVYAYAEKAYIRHVNIGPADHGVMETERVIFERRMSEWRP